MEPFAKTSEWHPEGSYSSFHVRRGHCVFFETFAETVAGSKQATTKPKRRIKTAGKLAVVETAFWSGAATPMSLSANMLPVTSHFCPCKSELLVLPTVYKSCVIPSYCTL